jgi:hypothetical protein
MAQTYSKTRQQAEIAFGKTQSQSIARERAYDELDSIVVARDEKTRRLREARLAKETQDLLMPQPTPKSKRAKSA